MTGIEQLKQLLASEYKISNLAELENAMKASSRLNIGVFVLTKQEMKNGIKKEQKKA